MDMKKLIIRLGFSIVFIFLLFLKVSSQTLIPLNKFYEPKDNFSNDQAESIKGFNFLKLEVGFEANDSRVDVKNTLDKIIDSLNKTDNFSLLASGGLTNLQDIDNSYGSLGVGLLYRLSKYHLLNNSGKNSWIDPHYLYFMFNTKTGSSRDSSVIQKGILFPELVKRDLVIGYNWEVLNAKTKWAYAFNTEFSLSRFDSSDGRTFTTQNLVSGFKVSKGFYNKKFEIPSYLQLFLYYHLINIDPKFFKDYNSLVGEENAPPSFHTLGLQTTLQVKNVTLFSNMKYILNNTDKLNSPDLKRFVYTFGTLFTL